MTEFILEGDKKQRLDVYEARVLNKQYSDDTWQLTKYTSELRNRSDDSFYCFIDFNADGEGTIRECLHCLKYEIRNKLGPKILKKGELKSSDYENWLQCHSCGNIYPIFQTYPESEIRDTLQTVTNPFEEQASIFLSVGRRKVKDRRNKYQDEDPDIAEEIRKHGSENVRILYQNTFCNYNW